jgi:hypothetical protein
MTRCILYHDPSPVSHATRPHLPALPLYREYRYHHSMPLTPLQYRPNKNTASPYTPGKVQKEPGFQTGRIRQEIDPNARCATESIPPEFAR